MKLTGLTFTAQYLVNSIDFTRNRFISLLYIYFHYNLRAEKWMVFSFCFKNCSFVRNTNIKILRIKILKSLQGTFAHTSKIYFFPIFLQTIDNRRMSNVCDILCSTL